MKTSQGVAGVRAGTMSEPFDEAYFKWLCRQVESMRQKNPAHTHWKLLKQLFTKEFIWIVPNDDNRLEDGRDLREEFAQDVYPWFVAEYWMQQECSMLEMLIALARRLAFEDAQTVRKWFWEMMHNLNLTDFNDASEYPEEDIDQILDAVIWRTYHPSGRGGLFPLHHAEEDQRDVEIWYQLSAYLAENGG